MYLIIFYNVIIGMCLHTNQITFYKISNAIKIYVMINLIYYDVYVNKWKKDSCTQIFNT